MKNALYIIVAFFLLQGLKKPATASAPATGTTPFGAAPGEVLQPVSTPLTAPTGGNVFMDESGDLVTINSTGGTTVLPDPNGIGGGFAT